MFVYKVWNCKLEVAEVLDEHYLCEGATQETYLLKVNDRKFITSKDNYCKTELEAWQKEEKLYCPTIIDCENEIHKLQAEILNLKNKHQKVKDNIDRLISR